MILLYWEVWGFRSWEKSFMENDRMKAEDRKRGFGKGKSRPEKRETPEREAKSVSQGSSFLESSLLKVRMRDRTGDHWEGNED